jgi:hypothetical protein
MLLPFGFLMKNFDISEINSKIDEYRMVKLELKIDAAPVDVS